MFMWLLDECVMLPWQYNICMDGCIRDVIAKGADLGSRLREIGTKQSMVAGFFADDTAVGTNERMLQRIVDEFNRMCKRKKLKVNVVKSKVIHSI